MVSQARTAGRAFRVWRIQRQLDSDVDGLSANKQENLGRHLTRTDGGGGEAYDDLAAIDSDAADALVRIQDPLIERQFVDAYRRGEVDDEQLASALRRYDELDADRKGTADEVIDETGASGVKLLARMDGDGLRRVLDLDIKRADEFRAAAARNLEGGYATTEDIDNFARYADNLEGIDGLNSGPISDFITASDPGNVKGALREVRRADEIGAENIERMSLESSAGELDIQTKSGKIVESKSTFGYNEQNVDAELRKKLTAMRDDPRVSFDGNTLRVIATKVDDRNMVKTKIKKWENKVESESEWNNANIQIKVVDERTETTIKN